MTPRKSTTDAGGRYIDVLTSKNSGTIHGYLLIGANAGPQVVVAGMCSYAVEVFDRLLSTPTLPWMRGNLVMIQLDALEDLEQDTSSLAPLGIVDQTIILPCGESEFTDNRLVRASYHMVLRACAELGMIAGRRVSSRTSL